MSDSGTPTPYAHENLRQRCERLAKYISLREGGEEVPLTIVDDAARMVREALDRWSRERAAEGN